MNRSQASQDLMFHGQALQEAIALVSNYEELLEGLAETPDERDLLMEFESLSPQTADLQTRFSPHLNTLSLLAAQLDMLQSKLDGRYRPTAGDISAVKNTLANLESEYRVVPNKLEDLDRWVHADRGRLLKEIGALSRVLENLKGIFQFSNELAASSSESDIFRQTVISLLAATIEELKAPVVNVGRLYGIGQMLKGVLKRSAEKKLGETVDAVLDQAVSQADKVIEMAKDLPGIGGFL